MRRMFPALATALALGVSSLAAQPLGTDFFTGHTSGRIIRSTMNGPSVQLPGSYGYFINGLTMDTDNRSLVAIDSLSSTGNRVIRIDPNAGAIIGTVFTGTPFTNVQSWIDVDDDGDYLVADRTEIFKVNRNGLGVTTLFSDASGYWFAFCEDRTTGNYLLGDFSNRKAILTVDRDTLAVTSITPVGSSITGMMQDPHDVRVYCSGTAFVMFNPQTFAVTTINGNLGRGSANVGGIDRSPAANGGLLYGGLTTGDVIQLDRQGNILGTVASTGGGSCLGFTFDRSRNIAAELVTAPNDRLIRLSLPGDAGKPYAVGVGISGCVPGFALPDQRVIPLNLDNLAIAGLKGLLAPLVTNTIGILNAFDEATLNFNANALGASVKGVRVWFAAASFDPAQPFGISQIAGPLLVVL